MVMCLVINKALDHSQCNLNWRLWPHVTTCHVIRMIKAHQTIFWTTPSICACDLRLPGWEWLAFHLCQLATPSLGSNKLKRKQDIFVQFKDFFILRLVDVDWCWSWLTDNQGGWNCFYERPLFRAQVKYIFWRKKKSCLQNIKHAHQQMQEEKSRN